MNQEQNKELDGISIWQDRQDLMETYRNKPLDEIVAELKQSLQDSSSVDFDTKLKIYKSATQYTDTQAICILHRQQKITNLVNAPFDPYDAESRQYLEPTIIKDLIRVTEKGTEYPEPHEVGAALQKVADFAYIKEQQQLYRKVDGLYIPDAEIYIKNLITKQIPELKSGFRKEVVYFISDNTSIDMAEFDQDKNILNCLNGFVNLTTGELLPHSTDYKSLIQIDTEYMPDLGTDGHYKHVLKTACADYWELICQIAACALSRGDINPELSLVFVADGDNGKSTIIEGLEAVFGKRNVSHVSMQYIQKNPFAAYGLVGKLLNLYHDLPDDEMRRMDKLKPIISQETISVEKKRIDAFDAVIFAIQVYSTNEMPALDNTGHANMKRFNVIPFKRRFTKDDAIKAKLKDPAEKSRALNLFIEYLHEVRKSGVTKKQTTKTTEALWRGNSDAATAFVVEYMIPLGAMTKTTDERGQITEPEDTSDMTLNPTFQQVYTTCTQWCYHTNRPTPSDTRLSKALSAATLETYTGRENKETVKRVRGYLKDWQEPEPDASQTTLDTN